MKTKIKAGDLVKVISGGKDIKGKTGKVLEVLRDGEAWRVRVEAAHHQKHTSRKRTPPRGGIIGARVPSRLECDADVGEARPPGSHRRVVHVRRQKQRGARHKIGWQV